MPLILVGGGPVHAADLAELRGLALQVVAADGGAVAVLEAGVMPRAVIGDFDSLPRVTREALPPDALIHVTEQDSTDFEKCMMRLDAPLILGLGFTGGRIDHQLAVMHGILVHAHKPCVLVAEQELVLQCPPHLALEMAADEVVSLFPLQPVTGRSQGLRWPIAGLDFAPGRCIGTSNAATGGPMVLEMDGPGMIAILPRARLGAVMQALLHPAQGPGRWPAP